MRVKKISTSLEKIVIDLVLCPKTNLYLQSLYCRRCGYYKSDEKDNINCNYKKSQITVVDPQKELLIQTFSEIKEKKENSAMQFDDKGNNDQMKMDIELLRRDLHKEIKEKRIQI